MAEAQTVHRHAGRARVERLRVAAPVSWFHCSIPPQYFGVVVDENPEGQAALAAEREALEGFPPGPPAQIRV
jgi:hypothetical protein